MASVNQSWVMTLGSPVDEGIVLYLLWGTLLGLIFIIHAVGLSPRGYPEECEVGDVRAKNG
ncbi:hypothetical protein MA16_Dca022004 [Dendrobium catenatum]|uniref:Uncharacterized protein n=1 Tax=Dendrobium catenatum TaxID=906689 RepID=A0A2I0X9W9_9ASPA|nr:hypothetical protein MA16_Dca022004 [Dendrobium catenatum]